MFTLLIVAMIPNKGINLIVIIYSSHLDTDVEL